jgi:hypothetical protein
MKYILFRLKRFCGFITGFVFLIAGIFKLMDPVGTGLIMSGYFDFMHLDFLEFAAKPTGISENRTSGGQCSANPIAIAIPGPTMAEARPPMV